MLNFSLCIQVNENGKAACSLALQCKDSSLLWKDYSEALKALNVLSIGRALDGKTSFVETHSSSPPASEPQMIFSNEPLHH